MLGMLRLYVRLIEAADAVFTFGFYPSAIPR